MTIDYSKPLVCCYCGGNVDVQLPIWVTPGDDHVDTTNIYWTGAPIATWCCRCQDHNVRTSQAGEDRHRLFLTTCGTVLRLIGNVWTDGDQVHPACEDATPRDCLGEPLDGRMLFAVRLRSLDQAHAVSDRLGTACYVDGTTDDDGFFYVHIDTEIVSSDRIAAAIIDAQDTFPPVGV